MAKKITLFTRFLKGWTHAADDVVPEGATKAVELETGDNFGWKAKPLEITPPVDHEPPLDLEDP